MQGFKEGYMRKTRYITAFSVILLLSIILTGCSSKEKTIELKPGKYIKEDTDLLDMSYITIEEDNKFTFTRGIALSYLPTGTYSIDSDKLTLYVSDGESYIFEIEKDKLIFESSTIDISEMISKGAIYKLTETQEEATSESTKNGQDTNKSINLMANIEKKWSCTYNYFRFKWRRFK